MTNAEKFLKDGISIEELIFDIINFEKCWNRKDFDKEVKRIKKFFFTSLTPTLTEDERVILNFIKNFDYIGRDERGLYYKLQDEDVKEKTAVIYNLTTNLFQFIKERRRIFYWGTSFW